MKPTEAAALLTIAAAYDNRKPDADQAKAWAMALDGLRFEDCRDVVVQHYQGSREWMMPFDVIGGVKRLRQKRVLAYGTLPQPPAGIDPDDARALQAWQRATTERIADGEDVPREAEAVLPSRPMQALPKAGTSVPDVLADSRAKVRAAHEAARRASQAARKPEPEPLLTDAERSREPVAQDDDSTDYEESA